jgi:alcohol dehydrogenase class IV
MVWWFHTPHIVFGEDALSELELIKGKRAIIITDPVLNELGLPEKVISMLKENGWEVHLWAKGEPDPRVSTVEDAAKHMNEFKPDWIIALGGGSVMDTAKSAWILYEYPETDLAAVTPLEPLYLRNKAKLICIPTTAGTGSEATKDIVLREDDTGRKFATLNPDLVPDLAILDPEFTKGLPKNLTAYTGMDALVHAVEAYISVWKNDFSDACSLKAVQLVFDWLPKSVEHPDDLEAREKMLIAANMAGMSFSNSQVALAHSLGHTLGSVLRLQHGLAVGLVLPYTIEYNQKDDLDCAKNYWELARLVGPTDDDPFKASIQFAERIRELQETIGAPRSLKEAGVSKQDFEKGLEKLVEFTMMDSSITMNPRDTDSEIIRKIYQYMYDGTPIDF